MESAPVVEKSDGELSEGELSSEDGEISDEGELPESEPEVEVPPKKSPESVKSHDSGDRFDRYKIWQEAMVNNMRSVISKVGDNGMSGSSEETTDSEDENSAFMMNDSEIPPNLRGCEDPTGGNLLGALGVRPDENGDGEMKKKKKKKKRGTPSEWWERHKEIYEKMKERREEMDAFRAKTPCKFFQKGFCKEGDECPFLHEVLKKLDVCKYFMKNLPCHKGDHCPYMHNEYPCKFFHLRGFCYNDEGCRFSHEALTDDTRQIIEFMKNDRFDRGSRFKRHRSRSRSRSRSPHEKREKTLFSETDSSANKKVLLPTPAEKEERESRDHRERSSRDSSERNSRYSDRHHDRSPYHRERENSGGVRGGRGGFFRGRGRGGGGNGGGDRGRGYNRGGGGFNRRGGFNESGGFDDRNNNNSRGQFNQGPPSNMNSSFNNGPPQQNFTPNRSFPAVIPPLSAPAPFELPVPQAAQQVGSAAPNFLAPHPAAAAVTAPFQQADFVPLQYQRPPPPPPPPKPLTSTSDFGGNKSAEQVSAQEVVVCAARDPRLKQNSEREKSIEPSLADMFKSLDPTASPFG